MPHIEAASWRNVLYGLGYMHGLDRPTQMLFARAIAQGRSTELIRDRAELGEADRFFRQAGLFLRLDEEARGVDPTVLGDVAAYCDGVNDGIRTPAARCRCGSPAFVRGLGTAIGAA